MKIPEVRKKTTCRVCTKKELVKVIDLSLTPLANAFLNEKQLNNPEKFYPLQTEFCKNCTFLQLGHVVDPTILFGNYVYVSSTSPVFINHFKKFADDAIKKFDLNASSLIVDIGSNDGILLKPFVDKGIRVLGIEPAKHIADMARKKGVDTIAEFFTNDVAKRIVKKYGKARIITGTNVFAHIDDLDEVLKGVNTVLDDEGMFVTESPYLVDFIKKRYFDLIYHEHVSYWAIKPLEVLLNRFDMTIFDVQKVPVHGGSIRVFAKKKKGSLKRQKSVGSFLKLERKTALEKQKTYTEYAKKILENKRDLTNMLITLKLQGKRIAGYGAPAKGNTLLQYFKLGGEILEYIVDDSPLKQGLYTPGTHIPVVSSEMLQKNKPDYLVILAWNFADPIMEKYQWFTKKGGKFIIPVPKPKIIS